MIRYFEVQDKGEIQKLASDFCGKSFDKEIFGKILDSSVSVGGKYKCISVLHAGEYLGYCVFDTDENRLTVRQMYIKPAFQKLKVSAQIFDFIEEHYPGYTYKAVCPTYNETALKVFKRRGYKTIPQL